MLKRLWIRWLLAALGWTAVAVFFASQSSPCDYDRGEWPLHVLVRKLSQHGKIKEALEVSKRFSEANPRSSLALDDLAQSYEDAGDRRQALALYKSSVAINPSYAAEGLRVVSRVPTP